MITQRTLNVRWVTMVDEIMLRLSPEHIRKIDDLISSGRFKNRAEVARTATIEFLNEIENEDKVNTNIMRAIDSGEFDDVLEVRVRRIISDIIGRE